MAGHWDWPDNVWLEKAMGCELLLCSESHGTQQPAPTSKDVDDASSYGVQLWDINKLMVHSWIDPALVSEKPVKSDDAGVTTGM